MRIIKDKPIITEENNRIERKQRRKNTEERKMAFSGGSVVHLLESQDPDTKANGGSDFERAEGDIYTISLRHEHTRSHDANANQSQRTPAGPWWGVRHTICLLIFFGITFEYMTRVGLSITIVAMVSNTSTTDGHENNTGNVCPIPDGANGTLSTATEGDFDWDAAEQGIILGSFFYGYVCTNFLGGRAAEVFGGKVVFGLGVVVSSILTVVAPFCAYASKGLFIANRVLQGLTQGVTFPSIHLLMATWIPPKDKARVGPFVFSGVMVGTVVAMACGGLISNSEVLGGWPSVFYIFGGLGVAWGVPWFLLANDRPEHHPRVVQEELDYIMGQQSVIKRKERVAIPWLDIARSVPFWTLMVCSLGYNYGFYTLMTELPTYLSNIQHFDMTSSGFMSALPYLAMLVGSLVWGQLMHVLSQSNKLSILAVRKISTAVAMYVPMVALVGMCWVDCDSTLAMIVLCLAVGTNGTNYSGASISEQDIAPNLAGTLKGITNTVGAATGIVAPIITGTITKGNQTLGAWRQVFLISSGLYLVTGTVYLILVTDKVQPWNLPKHERNKDKGDGGK